MAVNVDLGFILSLVDFFSLESGDVNLEVRMNTTVSPFPCIAVCRLDKNLGCSQFKELIVRDYYHLQTEYVKKDIEHVGKNLKETFIPEVNYSFIVCQFSCLHTCLFLFQLSDDFEIARTFFDVLHLAPIKVVI